MSKLTWHFQGLPQDIAAICAASGARYVKVIDPPVADPFPGKRTIGRTYLENDVEYIWRGAQGAVDWLNRWLPYYDARRWVHAWLGPNEPPTYGDGQLAAINEFYATLGPLAHQYGHKIAGLDSGEGHPPEGRAAELRDALAVIDYAALHEYGWPNVLNGAPYHILRYRATVAEWRAARCRVPPLLITECGVDAGTVGRFGGWRDYIGEEEFWPGLCAYDDELAKDPYVEAAFIFTSGPTGKWASFDFGAGLSARLAERIGQPQPQPEPQPVPVPTKAFDLTKMLPVNPDVEQFKRRSLSDITQTVIHHTYVRTPEPTYEAEVENIMAIARYEVSHGLPGVPYHILIGPSGNVYWANPSDVASWHAAGANENSRGIAFLKRGGELTPAALASCKSLIAAFGVPAVPHRWVVGSRTACPGIEVMRALGWA